MTGEEEAEMRQDELVLSESGTLPPGVAAAVPLVAEIVAELEKLTSTAANADHALRADKDAPPLAVMACFFLDDRLSEAKTLADRLRRTLNDAQQLAQQAQATLRPESDNS